MTTDSAMAVVMLQFTRRNWGYLTVSHLASSLLDNGRSRRSRNGLVLLFNGV